MNRQTCSTATCRGAGCRVARSGWHVPLKQVRGWTAAPRQRIKGMVRSDDMSTRLGNDDAARVCVAFRLPDSAPVLLPAPNRELRVPWKATGLLAHPPPFGYCPHCQR